MYQQRVEGLIGKREPREDSSDVRVWYQVFPVDLSPGSFRNVRAKTTWRSWQRNFLHVNESSLQVERP